MIRFSGNDHYAEWRSERLACIWCQWKAKTRQGEINEQNPPQSQIWCSKCNVALCCNKTRSSCFKEYHTHKE